MEPKFGFIEVLEGIKRRKKTLILSFLLIFPMVVVVALLLPPIYRADTTILRETQQVSEKFQRSTDTTYAEERVNAATQQVMSRSNLMNIINLYNLYPEMRDSKTAGEIIAEMKGAITLETLYAKVTDERTGRFASINTAFKLSYEGKDPIKVQKVTNTLASLYIELEEQTRGKRSVATTTFFENELKNLREQMSVYEGKVQRFKEDHSGELPENFETNLRILDRMERDLDNVKDRLRMMEERKLFLGGQIQTVDPLLPLKTDEGNIVVNPGERLKRLRLQLMTLQSALSDKHPDIKRLKNEIRELEEQVGRSDEAALKVKRLQMLQEEYASSKGKLGPKHPDIIRLQKEIEAASSEVDELLTAKMMSEVSEERPDNPTYINLKTQIFVVEADIKNLMKDKEELEVSIDEYQARVENKPLVEKEYTELTRDYKGIKQKYDDISEKLMEARVAQGMEEGEFGERFMIVDPATLPDKPYKPNRISIIILGFILSLGIGVGLMVLQESMDHSIKSVDELNTVTGGNVFSVISFIETDEEKRFRRIKRIAWSAGVAGFIVAALVFVNQYLIPLGTLWIEIKNRLVII